MSDSKEALYEIHKIYNRKGLCFLCLKSNIGINDMDLCFKCYEFMNKTCSTSTQDGSLKNG